jgi:hypothetical protein
MPFSKASSRCKSDGICKGGRTVNFVVPVVSAKQKSGKMGVFVTFARLTAPVGKETARPSSETEINLCPRVPSALIHRMRLFFNRLTISFVKVSESASPR